MPSTFQCPRCSQLFASKQKLEQHLNKKNKCVAVKCEVKPMVKPVENKPEVKPVESVLPVEIKQKKSMVSMIKKVENIISPNITITVKNFTLTQLIALLGEDNIIKFTREHVEIYDENKEDVQPVVQPLVEPVVEAVVEPVVEAVIEAVDPLVQQILEAVNESIKPVKSKISKDEKENQKKKDKEILIDNLKKEFLLIKEEIKKKFKNEVLRNKKIEELTKKRDEYIENIEKSKKLPETQPTLREQVYETNNMSVEKRVKLAIETNDKILETEEKRNKILDRKGKETKETTALTTDMTILRKKLLDIKKSLRASGYDLSTIKFKKEKKEKVEKEEKEEDENYGEIKVNYRKK